jgi:hypothetical protein
MQSRSGGELAHLLVDSTALRLCGPGGWLDKKRGAKRRRAWKVLHLATDVDTDEITASVPPCADAVPSDAAETIPTLCDAHLRCIAECGRTGWQRASGYGWRALVESDISRWQRFIGDGLRSQTDGVRQSRWPSPRVY